MAKVTIVVGSLLVVLGIVGYAGLLGGGSGHVTALIPAFAGALFVVLGALAIKPEFRKHAMHAAAALGLLGFLGAVGGIVKALKWMSGTTPDRPGAVIAQSIMALICVIFVALCVRSFIAARKAREAGSAAV